MKKYIVFFLVCYAAKMFGQVPIPAAAQQNAILLVGGIAHLGNGQIIESSAIGYYHIHNRKIERKKS